MYVTILLKKSRTSVGEVALASCKTLGRTDDAARANGWDLGDVERLKERIGLATWGRVAIGSLDDVRGETIESVQEILGAGIL